ncbi:MAG: hypothetical protein V4487_07520 [Chlamydiota bacterium]
MVLNLRENVGITEFDPSKQLLDIKLIGAAIAQCLIENDPEGVVEIIEGHINCLNKPNAYQFLKMKNPTIKTLAKIMHAAHHNMKD